MFGVRKRRDVIHRWEGNPIITMEDIPFHCSDITNAGAVKVGDSYILILTIFGLDGKAGLYLAKSKDGYRFKVNETPLKEISKDDDDYKYKSQGIMDARITYLDGVYYVMYMVESEFGYALALGKTEDFETCEKIAIISEPDTKAGALFPEKINGRYARLERPRDGGRIWISYSDDLIYWGGAEVVMSPRPGYWDSSRIGCSAPPIRMDNGQWLLIYYGEKNTSAGALFRIGAAFLDADDPAKVVARTNVPILSPRELYERVGDINNLVFSSGAIVENNILALYYGAARSCICLGTTAIDEIVENCRESEKEF